jgi:hypothetical protein
LLHCARGMAIDESLNSAQSCRVCLKDFCQKFVHRVVGFKC